MDPEWLTSHEGSSPNREARTPSPKQHKMWTTALGMSQLQTASCRGAATVCQRESHHNTHPGFPGTKWALAAVGHSEKGLRWPGTGSWLACRNCYWTQGYVPNIQWGQTIWNVGAWSRGRFIARPYMETGGSCPQNPKLLKVLQQNPFIGKVRERCGCCTFFGVWSFVLVAVRIRQFTDRLCCSCYSLFRSHYSLFR